MPNLPNDKAPAPDDDAAAETGPGETRMTPEEVKTFTDAARKKSGDDALPSDLEAPK